MAWCGGMVLVLLAVHCLSCLSCDGSSYAPNGSEVLALLDLGFFVGKQWQQSTFGCLVIVVVDGA